MREQAKRDCQRGEKREDGIECGGREQGREKERETERETLFICLLTHIIATSMVLTYRALSDV